MSASLHGFPKEGNLPSFSLAAIEAGCRLPRVSKWLRQRFLIRLACVTGLFPRPLLQFLDRLVFLEIWYDYFQHRHCYIIFRAKEAHMRLDKYLKVSRVIKRRTVANEACDLGRVQINGKVAKASAR